MMSKMLQKLPVIIGIFIIVQTAFTQTTGAKKPDEMSAEFKKETLAFLRETAAELNNLRSAENRISFSAELAGLMWFQDEKEARGMFQSVTTDFTQLVMQYDSRLNQMEADVEGSPGPFWLGDDSEKAKLTRKFRVAMGVRRQIASSIAEHDPQMAFDFYLSSLNVITDPARRKQYENQDTYFESQLLNQIAERDASKATELGRKSIANGVSYQHIELLKKIYAKDPDKGAEFADAITTRLKDRSGNSESISLVLSLGLDNFESVKKAGGKKPMFSEQNLRDLSEILAQDLLNSDEEQGANPLAYVGMLEKFAPGRAAQVRAKFRRSAAASGTATTYGRAYAANANIRNPDRFTVSGSANSNSATASEPTQAERARAERQNTEAQAMSDVQKLNKELPKEQREKVISQARKVVSEMGSKDQKILALSILGAQAAKAGDKELAAEIMRDAAGLVNPQPKNYKDFILVWMLASGYAEADPEKAFPLIHDAIYRLNEVITGVVRVAEFVDVAGEVVDDGEVQVGAFGGSMVRDVTRSVGMVNGTLRSLAKADLAKTKDLTNSFDRPELRVLAKMMVLRAILDDKALPDVEDGPEDETFEGP